MTVPFRIALFLPLALGACDAKQDTPAPQAEASSQVTASDKALIAAGFAPDAITAARNYLVPFTTADQARCFGDAKLGGAEMQARQDAPFTVPPGTTRVVLAIDGSGSMAARIGGHSKLDLAKESTLAFIDGLDPAVDVSLIGFGLRGDNKDSGKAQSCAAIDQLAPMSRERAGLKSAVQRVRAIGWTPLAAALRNAQSQLHISAEPGRQIIYVVSDGNETCGGDAVAAARAINTGNTQAIVNIIGFDLPPADRAALEAVAGAGGGRLINIADDAAYQRLMADFRETARRSNNMVEASNARARNAISTGAAITQAAICTGKIITDETLQVGADLTRRALDKQDAPERRTVFALLDQRHKAMTARREVYEARLKGVRDTAMDAIDLNEQAAK